MTIKISLFGLGSDFLAEALFATGENSFAYHADVNSSNQSWLSVKNLETGYKTYFEYRRFVFDDENFVENALLNQIRIRSGDGEHGTIYSDDGITVLDFLIAIDDYLYFGDRTKLQDLLEGSIEYKVGSSSEAPLRMDYSLWSEIEGFIELQGTLVDDVLAGTLGDDAISTGWGFDTILGTYGDDTIDFDFARRGYGEDFIKKGALLDYSVLASTVEGSSTPSANGISFRLNLTRGEGTIASIDQDSKAAFTDTLRGVELAVLGIDGGLFLVGTARDDSFLVDGQALARGKESFLGTGGGTVRIIPGAGNDTISLQTQSEDIVNLIDYDFGAPSRTLTGIVADFGSGIVSQDGAGGRDEISYGKNAPTTPLWVRATRLDDSIVGRSGDDIIFTLSGNDTVDGAGGEDFVVYDIVEASVGITVDMGAGTVRGTLFGEAFVDSLKNVEGVRGTVHGDSMTGSDGADSFSGAGGRDTIRAGDGQDSLEGNEGRDFLSGGLGDDKIMGNEGNDTLRGDQGDDLLSGGDGTDILDGGSGNDVLLGGAGNDTLGGGDGDDTLSGGSGEDDLRGGAGFDLLDYSGEGPFYLLKVNLETGTLTFTDNPPYYRETFTTTFSGIEGVVGTAMADELRGSDGDDFLDGGTGKGDLVRGRAGNDTLVAGAEGEVSKATLEGGGGDDFIEALGGHNKAFGGDGDDTVVAGGRTWVDGGAGFDLVDFSAEVVAINADLALEKRFSRLGTEEGPEYSTRLFNVEAVTGTKFQDKLRGDDADNAFHGGDGHDALFGRAGDDSLNGNEGDDTLRGGEGDDVLDGGTGADLFDGGAGDDTFRFDNVGDRIEPEGQSGNDSILSSVDLRLQSGTNVAEVFLLGAGKLRVDSATDVSARIVGNDGRNILVSHGGEDTLQGGAGNDTFAFVNRAPHGGTVTDFRAGDRIALDDRFFGMGGAGIDVRDVTQAQFSAAIRSGLAQYDRRTGELSYDRDGAAGPLEAVLIVTLDGSPRLSAEDFILF